VAATGTLMACGGVAVVPDSALRNLVGVAEGTAPRRIDVRTLGLTGSPDAFS